MENLRAKAKRIISSLLVTALTLGLVAGLLAIEPANAASEFSYASPFQKTGYSTYYHKPKTRPKVLRKPHLLLTD